ncbi:MAG: UDP-3-O-(3-hydroxymyristoyl)glucosamine N-acyltransferase [Planctomycetaceae bacterium]
MTITVDQLARQLQGEVLGNREREICDAKGLLKATAADVTFVADDQNLRKLGQCQAGVLLINAERLTTAQQLMALSDPTFVVVADPLTAFIETMKQFRPHRERSPIGVSPHAHVDASASIGADTNIHPGAVIGPDVVIGGGCDIHPGVVIGAGCRIGEQTTIHPHVVLYPEITVGNRVQIHANSVIGADGFGYRFEQGRFLKIPQLGTVRIDDDVEIGACTTIDRGMVGATIIGEGTKLDNLVMIAHNCELGKHNAFVSQVGLAGSVTTGDYVRCAGQVGIADHIHLGTGCTLAAKAGVHKNIPEGQTHIGAPSGPIDEQIKIMMAMQKAPEMRTQLRQLERQVTELTKQLAALRHQNPDSLPEAAAA